MSTELSEPAASWGNDDAYCIPAGIVSLLKAQAIEPSDNSLVHLKLFTPDAGCTWWISEWHDEESDILLFGLCDLGMGFPELGYVSLNELKSLRGRLGLSVERDLYWEPAPLTEVTAKHGR